MHFFEFIATFAGLLPLKMIRRELAWTKCDLELAFLAYNFDDSKQEIMIYSLAYRAFWSLDQTYTSRLPLDGHHEQQHLPKPAHNKRQHFELKLFLALPRLKSSKELNLFAKLLFNTNLTMSGVKYLLSEFLIDFIEFIASLLNIKLANKYQRI